MDVILEHGLGAFVTAALAACVEERERTGSPRFTDQQSYLNGHNDGMETALERVLMYLVEDAE